jgi:hypothetical protein
MEPAPGTKKPARGGPGRRLNLLDLQQLHFSTMTDLYPLSVTLSTVFSKWEISYFSRKAAKNRKCPMNKMRFQIFPAPIRGARVGRVVTRFRLLLLAVLVAESAARSPAPQPAPPPAAPASQVIAAIRASEAQAAELAPSPAARIRHGLIHADRLTGPLARLDPAHLDPRLAEHLLSR